MKSCSIIAAHYESLPFLRTFIRQVRRYENKNVKQHIIIAEQSCDETYNTIVSEYGNSMDITIVRMASLYSGYGMDYVLRNIDIKTDYILQIHIDCIPISRNYISLCIALIEEYNLSFVGQLHFINESSSIYPPVPFFSMSPTFNVAKTETYKEMALEAGFTRFHNRQTDMTFKNNDWNEWAAGDYNARGSDDDVVAFCWESKHRNTDKVGLAITGFIESSYGRLIEDVLLHFGSCREAISVMGKMPEGYRKYTQLINENYSDELIDQMVELAKKNRPPETQILTRNFWNGKLKQSFPTSDELNKRIEELKK